MIALDDAEAAHAELLRRRVFVSRYGDRPRVSLHFYNDQSDIDQLVDITAPQRHLALLTRAFSSAAYWAFSRTCAAIAPM